MLKSITVKNRPVISFSRLTDGEVIAEVVGEDGAVIQRKNFGKFTEEEYEQLFSALGDLMPEIVQQQIDVTGN